MPFTSVLALWEMKTVFLRIWTQVTVSTFNIKHHKRLLCTLLAFFKIKKNVVFFLKQNIGLLLFLLEALYNQNGYNYFYHLGFSDYFIHLYCYFHNVSADMSSGLLQVFVELGTYTELRIKSFIESTEVACSHSVSHNRVQVLNIPVLLLAFCQDWTCNLQMIVPLEA